MRNESLKVADVFRAGFARYRASAGPLPKHYHTIANAIMACGTAVLGGHAYACDNCGHERIAYNSCRNRHCPSCQGHARARWVERRMDELLDVPYFHVVFTIPDTLNPFALRNKAEFYGIMFRAASETLAALAKDPKRLGAQMGFISVLHTWGQNLFDHPHLHCIIPAGGLREDQWISSKNHNFLFPVAVLSTLFRAKFMDYFRAALKDGSILPHGTLSKYRDEPERLKNLVDSLYTTPWVVYAKPPFAGPQAVIKYLGRYTHRIAIANSRLVSVSATTVSFKCKDYRDNNTEKVMTLDIAEFLRRFMLHVLPRGFVRIRYFGFLSCRSRADKLPLCMSLAGKRPHAHDAASCGQTADEYAPFVPTAGLMLCPHCHAGHLRPCRFIHKPDPGGELSKAA